MSDELSQFLAALWPEIPETHWLLFWGAPSKRSAWAQAITDETLTMLGAWAAKENVYLGCATRGQSFGPTARGKRTDCAAIPGLWLDIDYGPEHKKTNLPTTEQEARGIVEALGLSPSILVHSGRGLQAWWLFKEPWLFDSNDDRDAAERLTEGWSQTLRTQAAALGWDADPVGDLPRVMRLPGLWNRKGVPVKTRLLACDPDRRYNPSDFEPFLTTMPVAKPTVEVEWKITKSPGAEPPSQKFLLLCEHDSEFRRLCLRVPLAGQKDTSASGFDFLLAQKAFAANWDAQEIVNLLIAQRRAHRADLKIQHTCYYEKTLSSAFHGTPETARERLIEDLKAGKDMPEEVKTDPAEILAVLSGLLGVTITKFVRYQSDENTYQLIVNERPINIRTVETFDVQAQFRRMILDHTDIRIPLFKPDRWGQIVAQLFRTVENVHVATADQAALYSHHLEVFLTSGTIAEDAKWQDACLNGSPFRLDGSIYIPTTGLLRFLNAAAGEKVSHREMAVTLTKLGHESVKKEVKGRNGTWTSRNCWRVRQFAT